MKIKLLFLVFVFIWGGGVPFGNPLWTAPALPEAIQSSNAKVNDSNAYFWAVAILFFRKAYSVAQQPYSINSVCFFRLVTLQGHPEPTRRVQGTTRPTKNGYCFGTRTAGRTTPQDFWDTLDIGAAACQLHCLGLVRFTCNPNCLRFSGNSPLINSPKNCR